MTPAYATPKFQACRVMAQHGGRTTSMSRPKPRIANCLAAASATLADQPVEARRAMERLLRLNPSLGVVETRLARLRHLVTGDQPNILPHGDV